MDKHLFFTLSIFAALLCSCSVQKEPEPKAAAHEETGAEVLAQIAPPTTSGRSVICSSQVAAYNPSDSSKQLGFFKAGSQLHIGAAVAPPGMVLVTYQDPGGPLITALCRAEDVGSAPATSSPPAASTAAAQPELEKPKGLGGSRPAQSNPNYKPIGQK